MRLLWYVYSQQIVSGPHSTEVVERGLQNCRWSLDALIWRKGQRDWLPMKTWQQNLETILEVAQTTEEKTVWYVDHSGIQHGPLNANELKNYLETHNIFSTCRVWTMGMYKWSRLFEVPELLNLMPIARRKFQRAPIRGNVFLKNKFSEFTAKLEFIGEGGLGTKNSTSFAPGDQFDAVINSPMLSHLLHTKVVVVGSTAQGATGFRFVHLRAEPQSTIIDYVKQFHI